MRLLLRPAHAQLPGLVAGAGFRTRLVARRNIAEVLREELLRLGYQPEPLALGTVTDAYQPIERRLRLTRAVLEVLHAAGHPVVIVTKSSAWSATSICSRPWRPGAWWWCTSR